MLVFFFYFCSFLPFVLGCEITAVIVEVFAQVAVMLHGLRPVPSDMILAVALLALDLVSTILHA